jgi:hypothetical protein
MQFRENLVVLGEAALLLLGEEEAPVRDDVVLALLPFDRLRVETLLG